MCLLFFQQSGFCQEKTIPDGTQGEVFELDSGAVSAKKKKWNLFPGTYSSLKIGGGFLYEFAGYSQDLASQQQMDSLGTKLEPTFKVRDFRFVVSGQLKKTRRSITWKGGFMYDAASDSWLVRETGIMVGMPELSGYVFVGRTKEGFSLNKVMNGYAGWGMERQMALDVIPILADGIKWLGFIPKQRLIYNVGIFTDWLSHGQSFSTYDWQANVRMAWLPMYEPARNKLVHIGTSLRYGKIDGGTIRVRSRPEANPAPYFIDTGEFPAARSIHYGIEFYYTNGPWMIGSEFYWHRFDSPGLSNPSFYGGEWVVSYILTGQSRPYSTVSGIYAFVPVPEPVLKGGWGTWELLFRLTSLDLDDGLIRGGKLWRFTPMINWYMSDHLRLEFVYGYGVMDRFGLSGTTQFFQARMQFTVL